MILCANSRPALNDVTYNELTILTKRVAAMCSDIETALQQGKLLVMESGQASPCLDLRSHLVSLSFLVIGLKLSFFGQELRFVPQFCSEKLTFSRYKYFFV